VLAGLDSEADRQAFRSLLRRLATHADVVDPARDACTIGRQASPAGAVPADRDPAG
jgi:hypothetical protein